MFLDFGYDVCKKYVCVTGTLNGWKLIFEKLENFELRTLIGYYNKKCIARLCYECAFFHFGVAAP